MFRIHDRERLPLGVLKRVLETGSRIILNLKSRREMRVLSFPAYTGKPVVLDMLS
jgi:hypothetical protein